MIILLSLLFYHRNRPMPKPLVMTASLTFIMALYTPSVLETIAMKSTDLVVRLSVPMDSIFVNQQPPPRFSGGYPALTNHRFSIIIMAGLG